MKAFIFVMQTALTVLTLALILSALILIQGALL